MRRILSLLCPLVLLFSGCVQEELQTNESASLDGRIFTASFEQDQTRTYLEDGNLLRWNAGDQISLFDGNTLNRQYQFDGETGDNSGTFSIVDKPYGTGNALNANCAVYPYASDVKISEGGVITAMLPSVQNYAENSFGLGANTMVAVTKDVDDTFLKFKNTCGYLKLQLYGEDVTVKSISLKGNNNEKLAGKANITPIHGDELMVTMSDEATTNITLNCAEGVKIEETIEAATSFWIVVPPTTFESGFNITVTDINGEIFTKFTSNEIHFERNVIKPMKAFELKIAASKPAKNEIWYTSIDGKVVQPYDANAFGATIMSNIYEYGKGVITFDDEVNVIGDDAFRWSSTLTSVIIPDGVTSIGKGPFNNCPNLKDFKGKFASDDGRCLIADGVLHSFAPAELTEYTIDENVITIGDDAFVNCDHLTNVTIPNSVKTIEGYAFAYCDGITSVIIPDSVTTVGEASFFMCTSLTSVNIGNGVTTIGKAALAFCSSLREFKGKYACDDGRSLIMDNTIIAYANASGTEYTIPDRVTLIGDYAFSYCNITNVVIPDDVTAIGDYAFYSTPLSSLYCMATNPPTLAPLTFAYTNINSIYVPFESVDIYKAADYWKDLNIIGIGSSTEQFPWFNPDQYITYVENYEVIEPNADDWYEYSSSIDCPISPFSKIELKYKMVDDGSICYLCCRNRARENTSAIYLDKYGLVITDEDEDEIREYTYSWGVLNVNKSDCMILTISFKDKEIKINDTTIEYKMDKLSSFRSGLLFSYFTSENDEGTWRVSGEGVPEGSKLYYVKIWDENGNLAYLGAASKAFNSKTNQEEYCWQSYYNETNHYEFAYYPTTHSNYSPYGGGVDK